MIVLFCVSLMPSIQNHLKCPDAADKQCRVSFVCQLQPLPLLAKCSLHHCLPSAAPALARQVQVPPLLPPLLLWRHDPNPVIGSTCASTHTIFLLFSNCQFLKNFSISTFMKAALSASSAHRSSLFRNIICTTFHPKECTSGTVCLKCAPKIVIKHALVDDDISQCVLQSAS